MIIVLFLAAYYCHIDATPIISAFRTRGTYWYIKHSAEMQGEVNMFIQSVRGQNDCVHSTLEGLLHIPHEYSAETNN